MSSTDQYEDYVNIHKFYELFWDRVSEDLVSNMYMEDTDNKDFIREITLSFYNEYLEDRVSINLAARLMEEFMKSLFKYKPDTSNIVDNYYNED